MRSLHANPRYPPEIKVGAAIDRHLAPEGRARRARRQVLQIIAIVERQDDRHRRHEKPDDDGDDTQKDRAGDRYYPCHDPSPSDVADPWAGVIRYQSYHY